MFGVRWQGSRFAGVTTSVDTTRLVTMDARDVWLPSNHVV